MNYFYRITSLLLQTDLHGQPIQNNSFGDLTFRLRFRIQYNHHSIIYLYSVIL